jgi:hypothetical protein
MVKFKNGKKSKIFMNQLKKTMKYGEWLMAKLDEHKNLYGLEIQQVVEFGGENMTEVLKENHSR